MLISWGVCCAKNTGYDLETKLIHPGAFTDPATGALASLSTRLPHLRRILWSILKNCAGRGAMSTTASATNLTELESKLAMLEGADNCDCQRIRHGGDCLNPAVTGENRRSYCQRGRDLLPTRLLMTKLLAKFGVEITFTDATVGDNIRAAVKPATKLVYVESPLNPSLGWWISARWRTLPIRTKAC